MADISTSPWIKETLEKESTKKYFVEYEIFKSNHMAHGIIALHRLGATESRIAQFVSWYGSHMEPPDYSNHKGENPEALAADDNQLESLLGERKNFYAIKNRYKMRLRDSETLETFIQREFPKLSRGMSCSALHGLIQVGYGYSASSSTVVCEGIAYLHHSFSPLLFDTGNPANDIKNFGRGTTTILEVLEELRSDTGFKQNMLDGAKKLAESNWDSSNFQYRLAATMMAGNDILRYVNKINIPCVSDDDQVDVIKVADWIIQQAIAVFVLSETVNDFFLLHGVTGAWSLRQIIPLLRHSDALDALRTFICVLLGVYVTQDSPSLKKPTLKKESRNDTSWKNLIDEALSSDRDEHIYKLIQVVYESWQKNRDNDFADFCLSAAHICLRNDLKIIDYYNQ